MILGIYHPAEGVGHDTAVALVDETGRILAAHSEERFSRVKMDGGFPFRAVEALRRVVPFAPSDIEAVAVTFMSPGTRAREGGHLLASALRDPGLALGHARSRLAGDPFQRGMEAIGAYRYVGEHAARVRAVWATDGSPALSGWPEFIRHIGLAERPLRQVDHHVAHAAGAYFTSGWDEALVVTLDGIGGLKSGLTAVGRGGRLRVTGRTFAPHSTGRFWETVTAICGFHHMKHGGKITGLAAHGDPTARCYPVMAAALALGPRSIRTALDPVAMARGLDGVPVPDIAATAQRRLEEVVTAFVRRAIAQSGVPRVAVAGGVFANVRLNQRIAELPECAELYVFPAMGDEGLGAGAALSVAARARRLEPAALAHVFLGPDYGDAEAEAALVAGGLPYRKLPEPELAAEVAGLLAGGRVVAVFRGRMEFGPRALGHRSVLSSAGDAAVNDWLNRRLRRTEFMPFAPVTLAEDAERCYRGVDRLRRCAPFMTATAECTDWMKRVSPAVVHVDGTARPQLVSPRDEPFVAEVLRRYRERTGVPSLINTSFNMHEEPIVESPRDAVRAFAEAGLEALAMGPFLVGGRSG